MSSSLHSRPWSGGLLYVAAAALFAFELGVVWLMLHPVVPADFRAYYIDRTTTCLNQPVAGTYAFGSVVSFLPDGIEAARPLRVCGWEGPAGDGTHAVGTSSRLRFVGAAPAGPQILQLEMAAVTKSGAVQPQRVVVSIDGQPAGELLLEAADSQFHSLALPPGSADDGRVEVTLAFPDAVRMGRTDPDTRWRSTKLQSAGILPAP